MDTSRFEKAVEQELLFALTDKGEFKRTCVSQIKIMNINYKGWQCPIANHSIYFRHSGNATSGICGEFLLATDKFPWWKVTDGKELLQGTGTCNFRRRACYCGSDINVAKCKTQEAGYEFIDHLLSIVHENGKLIDNYERLQMDDNIVALGSYYTYRYQRLSITLDYGKKCNLDCSYCADYIHDNFIPFLSLDKVEKMLDIAQDINPLGEKILIITGGEPTLAKELTKVVEMAKQRKFIKIHINTNSTASKAKYTKLIEMGCRIDCTFHEQYVTDKQIIKVRDLFRKYGRNNVLVKILGPNNSPFALRVKSIFGDDWQYITSHPIYNRDNYEIISV